MAATRDFATEYATAYGIAVNGTDAQRYAATVTMNRVIADAEAAGEPLDVLAVENGYRHGRLAYARSRYAR